MSANANIAALLYLVAGSLFILALKGLSSPASSRAGNRNGMIGMTIAVLTNQSRTDPGIIVKALLKIALKPSGECVCAGRR